MSGISGLSFVHEMEVSSGSCFSKSSQVQACTSQHSGETRALAPSGTRTKRPCQLVETNDHVHGPGCGHDAVPHGDHIDWLVGGDLQHIGNVARDACCELSCLGDVSGGVVSHGPVSALRNRHHHHTYSKDPCFLDDCGDVESFCDKDHFQDGVRSTDQTTRIYAAGICCPMEVPLIEGVLKDMPGVQQVDVAVITQTVIVLHDGGLSSAAALCAALNAVRLDASLTPPREQPKTARRWLPPWYLIVSAVFTLISLIHYLKKPTGHEWLDHFKWAAIAAVAIGIPVILLRALMALRRRILDINILMVVAVVGAIAIGDYTEAAAVVCLFGLAEWLEVRATGRARDAIAAIVALKPSTAVLASTGEEVPSGQVGVGVELVVTPGSAVPADGVVSSGHSATDESMITGEAAPVPKGPGDDVLGGTINAGDATLMMVTTSAADDSTVAELGRLVERAAGEKSPLEGAVAKFAKWYTPLVLFAAACIAFLPWAAPNQDRKKWVYLALQILVTACPCALVISTPIAAVCAIAAAARAGVLVRGGSALEALGKVRGILLDKTGTLTMGRCQVIAWEECNSFPQAEALGAAAATERGSSHPVASAIVGAAAAAGSKTTMTVTDSRAVSGQGVVAMVDGALVAVGNERLMASEDVQLDTPQQNLQATWESRGATVVWVAIDGVVAGFAAVSDEARDDAAKAIKSMQDLGIVCVMATGDSAGAAKMVAAAVGIPAEHVHSSLLPADKLKKVEEYKAASKGTLAVAGDGVNDAPALAASDVGIAMGARGSAAALEAASVSLFGDELDVLPWILRLGRSTRRTIHLNIVISVLTKVVALTLAAVGKFSLWGAVLVDVGTALAVIAHSLLLLRKRLRPKGEVVLSSAHLAAQEAAEVKAAALGPVTDSKPACCSTGKCTAAISPPVKECCDSKACSKTVASPSLPGQPSAPTVKPCCSSKKCSKTAPPPLQPASEHSCHDDDDDAHKESRVSPTASSATPLATKKCCSSKKCGKTVPV